MIIALFFWRISMNPNAAMPHEQWLYEDPVAMKLVQEGLDAAKRGDFVEDPRQQESESSD
jgi:hypothetical protein